MEPTPRPDFPYKNKGTERIKHIRERRKRFFLEPLPILAGFTLLFLIIFKKTVFTLPKSAYGSPFAAMHYAPPSAALPRTGGQSNQQSTRVARVQPLARPPSTGTLTYLDDESAPQSFTANPERVAVPSVQTVNNQSSSEVRSGQKSPAQQFTEMQKNIESDIESLASNDGGFGFSIDLSPHASRLFEAFVKLLKSKLPIPKAVPDSEPQVHWFYTEARTETQALPQTPSQIATENQTLTQTENQTPIKKIISFVDVDALISTNRLVDKHLERLQSSPHFPAAVNQIKKLNIVDSSFYSRRISDNFVLDTPHVNAFNKLVEQIFVYETLESMQTALNIPDPDPRAASLKVKVNYRGIKSVNDPIKFNVFTTSGNYQICKKKQTEAAEMVAIHNNHKHRADLMSIQPDGEGYLKVQSPKIIFIKGECDHPFGKFIRKCFNETTETTGAASDQCETVIVPGDFHTERENWIKKTKPYSESATLSYDSPNGIADLLNQWQETDDYYINHKAEKLEGIPRTEYCESYNNVRANKLAELQQANCLRVGEKSEELIAYHGNVVLQRGKELVRTATDSYVAGRSVVDLVHSKAPRAELARNYIKLALQDSYMDAVLRSRFIHLALQDCSPQFRRAFGERLNDYQNHVISCLRTCEFQDYTGKEINSLDDPQLTLFLEKEGAPGNKEALHQNLYKYGEELFSTTNPSVKGNKAKSLSNAFSKTRLHPLFYLVRNEERQMAANSNPAIIGTSETLVNKDYYAFYEAEIDNSVKGAETYKQKYLLDQDYLFSANLLSPASVIPPQLTYRPITSDQVSNPDHPSSSTQVGDQSEITASQTSEKAPSSPDPSNAEKRASLQKKDSEQVTMGCSSVTKKAKKVGKSLKNSFKKKSSRSKYL